MDQSPSWEADAHSASQILNLIWNPKVHHHVHKSLLLVPILSQMHLVHTLHPIPLRSILIISPSMYLLTGLLLQVFQPKYCTHFSFLSCILHAPPISLSLIWSPSRHFLLLRAKYSSQHCVIKYFQSMFIP